MSKPSNPSDLYADELKDLWSANDQMARVLKKIAPHATHPKLKQMLETSQTGIALHTDFLKTLLANRDEKVSKEHCKAARVKLGVASFMQPSVAYFLASNGPRRPSRVRG